MAGQHGKLTKKEPGWYSFEFPFNGQTIEHVFNEAELDALATAIPAIKAAEPDTIVDLMFMREPSE